MSFYQKVLINLIMTVSGTKTRFHIRMRYQFFGKLYSFPVTDSLQKAGYDFLVTRHKVLLGKLEKTQKRIL
jgi:hypothetical protein